jgi:tRNA pseudouridine55 synthase
VTAPDGLVVVDKPSGLTSHDVVARIRKIAGTRRAGHAGTLDPMATGVLLIGVGKATRLLGHLALTDKEYAATIRLGVATATDDAEGEVLAAAPAGQLSGQALDAAVQALTGEIQQVPPSVSAIKVSGRRAYRLARAGEAPELTPRTVTVSRLTVLQVRPAGVVTDLDVEVTCSTGTYIRAIARDLGAMLGVGGHLTALRRLRVGPYGLDAARTLDDLAACFEVLPLADVARASFRCRDLTAEQARVVAHGGRLRASEASQAAGARPAAGELAPAPGQPAPSGTQTPGQPIAAFGPDGSLIALLTEQDGQARPLAVFVP